ncbi:XRE family transcriptional regulator [Streptomyces xanthophaeus]
MSRPGNIKFTEARRRLGWHSQGDVADAYEQHSALLGDPATITVRQVRRWESADPGWPKRRTTRRVLESMFGVPLAELGFIPPPAGKDSVDQEEESMRRRSFLGSFVVGAAPLLNPTGQGQLAAALANARRYSDHALVGHLRSALDEAARSDGRTGPRQALPTALDLLAVIDELARDTRSSVRRELLMVGARAAEFTAFLHRDAGAAPQVTLYFHDRAIEWASITGDGPMHAYVLLRKAQATDRGDAAQGPWTLPPRARAEALQQEARALALTGAPPQSVARTLGQAHEALTAAAPAEPATCTGPLCAGYSEDRLMAQSAICHREAGQPQQAVTLLRQHLAEGAFATRDRAFFTAHLAGALASAGQPDDAAATGLSALQLAAVPGFGQALGELRRTAGDLGPYARRPAVRELRRALTALPV